MMDMGEGGISDEKGKWWYQRGIPAAAGIFIVDRFLKEYYVSQLNDSVLINSNFAFQIPFPRPAAYIGIVLALVWIGKMLISSIRLRSVYGSAGSLLILFGAASNIWDRLVYGGVVDYLAVAPVSAWFNLADVSIGAGIAFLFLLVL